MIADYPILEDGKSINSNYKLGHKQNRADSLMYRTAFNIKDAVNQSSDYSNHPMNPKTSTNKVKRKLVIDS